MPAARGTVHQRQQSLPVPSTKLHATTAQQGEPAMHATRGEADDPQGDAGAGSAARGGQPPSGAADGQTPGAVDEEARAGAAKQAAARALTGIAGLGSPQARSPASGRGKRHANGRGHFPGQQLTHAANLEPAAGAAVGPGGLPAAHEPAAALQDRTGSNAAAPVGGAQKAAGVRRRAPLRSSPQKENGGAGSSHTEARAAGDSPRTERAHAAEGRGQPGGPRAPVPASGSHWEPPQGPSQVAGGGAGGGEQAGGGRTTLGREVAWEGLAGLGVRWGMARERSAGEDASCQHAINTWAHAGLAGARPAFACSPACRSGGCASHAWPQP